jgi:lipopolysaccharide export system permease protein
MLSIAPIFITLVAIPIGIMSGKGGKAVGFGMSLGILFIFYMLLIVSLNIGEKGYVPSALILWLPNLVTCVAGILLFNKMSKK